MRTLSLSEAHVEVLDCEHRTPAPAPSGHPYIAIPDIQQGRVALETTRRISSSDLLDWTRRTKPQRGDILVTRRGRVGDTAPIPTGDCAIGQNLVLLRSDGSLVDQGYLRWATRSPLWRSETDRLMNVGAVFSSLNVGDIGKMRIPVPPFPEQQAIAEVLGALDDKIAANRALVTSSVQLTESLFTRTTQGLVLAPLSSIAIVNGDTIKPRAGDLRYIDIAAVSTDDYASPTPRSWANAPSRARRRVHHGDTLWSTVRPNRRARALVLEDDPTLVASTGLVTLSPRHQGFSFLHEATRTGAFADYLVANAEGSAYPAVTASKFDRAPVPAADADTIVAFNRLTDPLWERVGSARAEITTLASLRDTLLPALMDGTLRVKDAARVASEVL